jgi:hypothetical protein
MLPLKRWSSSEPSEASAFAENVVGVWRVT